MADKSVPQLNQITTINDTDLYHVVRNNIDYKITGEDIKRSINPYYEFTALISQFPSVSSYFAGPLPEGGAFYQIVDYAAGDDFSNLELVVGTNNSNGAVYRAISVNPTTWTNGTEVSNTNNPFISSINSVTSTYGAFINTFPSGSPYPNWLGYNTFTYASAGNSYVTFPINATSLELQLSGDNNGNIIQFYSDSNYLNITTADSSGTPTDGLLERTLIRIKYYY